MRVSGVTRIIIPELKPVYTGSISGFGGRGLILLGIMGRQQNLWVKSHSRGRK